jgi:hypothetical protein
MKTKILILLLLIFTCGCKEEHKAEILFIYEIINDPANMENIIKSSNYYKDGITKINYQSIYDYLKYYPKNVEFETNIQEFDEPYQEGLYPIIFIYFHDKYRYNTLIFAFIKSLNTEWKLSWISYSRDTI